MMSEQQPVEGKGTETNQPILVTGAAGNVGSVGFKIVESLRSKGLPVRAMVRQLDERSAALAQLGAEVVTGDLTDLHDVGKAIEGCKRIYFGMAASANYLEACINTAAVAKHHGVEVFVNISQMTVSEMNINVSTESSQQRFHWLGEQALNWSGLPVVHLRATVFLEHPFFHLFAAQSIKKLGEIRLPFARSLTSPIAAVDVAQVASEILSNPERHIGKVYQLTGAKSQDMVAIASEYSKALGREIKYTDVPFDEWEQTDLKEVDLPAHLKNHFRTMAWRHRNGHYNRFSEDFEHIMGVKPTSVEAWVRRNSKVFQS